MWVQAKKKEVVQIGSQDLGQPLGVSGGGAISVKAW
jgi:hypothetical protein